MLATRNTQFKSHYAPDDLTRVLFILPPQQASALQAVIGPKLADLNERLIARSKSSVSIHKAFFMKDFDSLVTKYPLVCLPSGPVEQLREVRA